MRTRELLTIGVAVAALAGCGNQSEPEAPDEESGVSGSVHLGPQCPVETTEEPCPDRPAAGVRVTIAEQPPGEAYTLGEVVARTTTDADGDFRVVVPPGDFVVTADAGMSCELMDVRVTAGAYAPVDVPCDTGIR